MEYFDYYRRSSPEHAQLRVGLANSGNVSGAARRGIVYIGIYQGVSPQSFDSEWGGVG